tara:strand:+ start:396 stop:566 length:171 start_codon:yes stop_codon:yes gene_type:complete
MIKEEFLVSVNVYNFFVNDIVNGWVQELLWLNGAWLNKDTKTRFECIVDYAIHQVR